LLLEPFKSGPTFTKCTLHPYPVGNTAIGVKKNEFEQKVMMAQIWRCDFASKAI
jgi:hypothetical protein